MEFFCDYESKSNFIINLKGFEHSLKMGEKLI